MIYDLPPAREHSRIFNQEGNFLSRDECEQITVIPDGYGVRVGTLMMDHAASGDAGVSDNADAQMAAMTKRAIALAEKNGDLSVAWAPDSMRAPRSRPAGASPLAWRAPPVGDTAARDAADGARVAAGVMALEELNDELTNGWRRGR